jgi:hypothetical protein
VNAGDWMLIGAAMWLVPVPIIFGIGAAAVTRYPRKGDPARNARRYTGTVAVLALIAVFGFVILALAGLTALIGWMMSLTT